MDKKMSEMKYKQGDILTDGKEYKKVLWIYGEVYLMSASTANLESDYLKEYDDGYTQHDLDYFNYKIYTPPKEVEMTVAEISEALGKTVKVVE